MTSIRLTTFLIACALALAGLVPTAGAAELRYTFTGSGAGTLAGQAFEQLPFAIVGIADSAHTETCAVSNCRYVDFSSASVHLEGRGDFALATVLRVYNTSGALGLSRGGAEGLDLYNGFNVAPGYDFAAPLGPLLAFASLLQWDSGEVLTSAGVLTFDNADTDGTFRAEGVPLPASAGLFASALLATVARRRHPAARRLTPCC